MSSIKLIFVYNAKAGVKNGLLDTLHKMVKPETYACNLCALTYGLLGEKRIWKSFRKKADFEMEFYHSNEFQNQFKSKFLSLYTFPIILIVAHNEMEVLITTEELSSLKSAKELIVLINERIAN
ncbi:MAG: GTPase [Leeuwenhoekiella sp.]